MKSVSSFFGIFVLMIGCYAPTVLPFVSHSQNGSFCLYEFQTFSIRSRCYRRGISTKRLAGSKPLGERLKLCLSRETNGNYKNDSDEYNYSGFGNGNYGYGNPGDPTESSPDSWRQMDRDDGSEEPRTPRVNQSPDRAVNIVSELKANAALFAAFAYGSLNLPSTLTVSESKVTSVTTSLSISRPLPNSDLIRTFVVLDVCTLCLMISCVAASQLLIYRLTDGSYEEVDEEVDENYDDTSQTKNNSKDSALGRLVTTYRSEFTVARITFDLGLVSLLLAVGVRSLATFDEDIVVPILTVIGITAVFLAVAYFTTYIEVFRTAENLKDPLYIMSFPFLSKNNEDSYEESNKDIANRADFFAKDSIASQIFLPFSLVSVGLGLYFALVGGSGGSESNLSRLGPYAVTPGANKLKVVTEKIDSDRSDVKKQQQNEKINLIKKAKAKAASDAEATKKKAAEIEAKKKADGESRRKAEEEINKRLEREARRRTDEEASSATKKAEEEMNKRLEKEARRRAEEGADAASAAAQAKVEAAMKKAEEEATSTSAAITS